MCKKQHLKLGKKIKGRSCEKYMTIKFKHKVLYFAASIILITSFGVYKYHSLAEDAASKENFVNFSHSDFTKITDFPRNNFYYNVAKLNEFSIYKPNMTLEDIDIIIKNSKSKIVKDQALLLKSDILFSRKKYTESLGQLNLIKSEILKPYVLIMRGDIFDKMGRADLAYTDYNESLKLVNDNVYKILILEKIKNLKINN